MGDQVIDCDVGVAHIRQFEVGQIVGYRGVEINLTRFDQLHNCGRHRGFANGAGAKDRVWRDQFITPDALDAKALGVGNLIVDDNTEGKARDPFLAHRLRNQVLNRGEGCRVWLCNWLLRRLLCHRPQRLAAT